MTDWQLIEKLAGALTNIESELKEGFVSCETCDDEIPTSNFDVVNGEIKPALAAYAAWKTPREWSDTPPTEAGEHWWFKSDEISPKLGLVIKPMNELRFAHGALTSKVYALNKYPGAQWAGPIPEPENT